MKSDPALVLSPSAKASKPKTPLSDALISYDQLGRRRFHVPAHSGAVLFAAEQDVLRDPYRYDLTELDGLDVLSEPSGCILEARQAAASAFGVAHTYFLVNGASVGLQAALLSVLKPGDNVLVPRNAHRSVLSGLILTGATPVWFLPERLSNWGLWGAVQLEHLKATFAAQPDIKALIITSPTYEGIGSDIAAIAAWCQEKGILLIVDEAHGSLWPFSAQLPKSACRFACDVVVHSLHKSGGSLTQTALAHLPHGSRVNPAVFQQALNTLQTTSPSYLLMASLDTTRAFLESSHGHDAIAALLDRVFELRTRFANLKALRLLDSAASWDPCKFYFRNPLEPNEAWGAHLEEQHKLAFESASLEGVLYLANLGLSAADFEFFYELIRSEDERLQAVLAGGKNAMHPENAQTDAVSNADHVTEREICLLPEMTMSPRDAFFAVGVQVTADQALGRVAKETIVHCPPGIPVLMPGEKIQAHHLPLLPDEGVLVVE